MQLPCAKPDLLGRIGYKYISQNSASGEVAFPIKKHDDGRYAFALHGHQDVTVALSGAFTITDHVITDISPVGGGCSSFAIISGGRRGRGEQGLQAQIQHDPRTQRTDVGVAGGVQGGDAPGMGMGSKPSFEDGPQCDRPSDFVAPIGGRSRQLKPNC